jgi:signal transduction histidine kinase
VQGEDELGRLGLAFDAMADRLQAADQALVQRKAEQYAAELERARLAGLLQGTEQAAAEKARLYAAVTQREQQLRELVGQLLVAEEEERRRLAYDVHDGLAQVAAGAYQHLLAFARQHPPRTAEVRAELDRAVELARETARQTRRTIAELRPTALDDFGLATAIRLEVDARRAEGWDITYDVELDPERLPPPIETALYRVLQEALTNVRKHADTRRAYVALSRSGGDVRLEVRDWGAGFDPSAAAAGTTPGEQVGLASMYERVRLLGGRCQVKSQPGGGTQIVAEVPLQTPHMAA